MLKDLSIGEAQKILYRILAQVDPTLQSDPSLKGKQLFNLIDLTKEETELVKECISLLVTIGETLFSDDDQNDSVCPFVFLIYV